MISFKDIIEKEKIPRSVLINCIAHLDIIGYKDPKKGKLYTKEQFKQIKKLAKIYSKVYFKRKMEATNEIY